MAWIQSHQSLSRHRKTLSVASALKTDRHKVLGHMHELWWWGLDNADINGLVGHVADEVIAEAAGWNVKQAHMFVGALMDAGFIDRTDQGLVLHDWYDYAGKLNDQRALRRESNRQAQSARRQRLRQHDDDDEVMTVSSDKADNQHPTVPNRTVPNHREAETNTPSGANAPSPPGAKRRRVTEVDDNLVSELLGEYAEAFGSKAAVQDIIDTALSHKARLKCTDERAYLRGWLRRDALRLGSKPGRKLALVTDDRPAWGCTGCGKTGGVFRGLLCEDCYQAEKASIG